MFPQPNVSSRIFIKILNGLNSSVKARAYILRATASWPAGEQTTIGAVDFVQKGNTVYVSLISGNCMKE